MHNLTLLIVSLLPLLSLAAPFPCKQAKLTEMYSFTPSNPLFVENILTLPDNRLLLTTFSPTGDLFVLDPNSPTPKPITVTSFPNTTVQLGIAPLGNHQYAVATGILGDLVFVYGTGNIRIVSLPPQSNTARQLDVIPVPDTYILNGMISLPRRPHVLLSADSTGGRILRTDTRTKRTTTVLSDPSLLGPGNNTVLPLGVNGIKIRGGHLYFTNSALGLFGRVRINEDGTRFGSEIEVLSRLRGEIGYANAFDDFAIDERTGDAYVTWHDMSLVRISRKRGEGDGKGWKQEVIVGSRPGRDGDHDEDESGRGQSEDNLVVLKAPTAVAFGNSGKELYVTTAGQVNGTRIGGQVVRVDLC